MLILRKFIKVVNVSLRTLQTNNMAYTIVEKGTLYSPNYRIYFKNDQGKFVSPLHDIPLFACVEKKIYNMVVEIPRWTNAKIEINLKEILNPIKQDIKNEKPRFVPNCFPHKGYIWNYGALPQTWEDPNIIDENTKCKGDNDPIDCLEIGSKVAKQGDVLQVKILGCIALIDEGETDWKIITINVDDPAAKDLNDITDIEKKFPGLLRATVEWFKIYKIPDGKPENQFAFNGEPKQADFAAKIVEETHGYWKKLISKQADENGICLSNTTLEETSNHLLFTDAESLVARFPDVNKNCTIHCDVDKWHFVHLNY